jgi:amidophosphoribosyltransferase
MCLLINDRVNEEMAASEYADNVASKANIPYVGNFLGHVRYGTFGKNSIESVHPFTSEQLDAQEPDSWNFNMTNVKELFKVWWN